MRFITSPSQKTGMEMPMRPRTISSLSSKVPRVAAAARPMSRPKTTQSTAAPITSDSVTGTVSSTAGTTFQPRLTKEVRSRVMKSFFIMTKYCT